MWYGASWFNFLRIFEVDILHIQRHRNPDEKCECRKTGYWWALWLAVGLVVFQAWGSFESWSLSLFGDTWHVLTHIPFYGVAIYAFFRKNKARFEILMANILLVVSGIGMLIVPLRYLFPEVHPEEMLWVATIGLAVNLVMFLLAHFAGESDKEDHVHEGVWLHIFGDTLMSIVVVCSALLMRTGIPAFFGISNIWIDAAAALFINIYIMRQAIRFKRKARHSH